jgi:hypothetical protein
LRTSRMGEAGAGKLKIESSAARTFALGVLPGIAPRWRLRLCIERQRPGEPCPPGAPSPGRQAAPLLAGTRNVEKRRTRAAMVSAG